MPVLQARIRHHLGVDRIAGLAQLVDDPGERDDLVLRRLYRAGEGRELAIGNVVADAFHVGQSPVLLPDLPGHSSQPLVIIELCLRHRHNKSVNVGHRGISSVLVEDAAGGSSRQHAEKTTTSPHRRIDAGV